MLSTPFTQLTGIQFPVIMAPMFLVSNEAMMIAGMKAGIMAVFPTLNYRRREELAAAMDALNAFKNAPDCSGSWGVNLIVQQTNIYYADHLKLCVEKKCPFYITSLGNPEEVIQAAHSYGAKVFCDVTTLKHAEKAVSLGCDGLIAVGQGAGGHAGPVSLQVMVPVLKKKFPGIPVIAAGGVATGAGLLSVMALGADGASVGTRFIASPEAGVREEYKQAIVQYGMEDVVLTEKISGTPCNVINTPHVQKAGTKQNWFERFLNNNRRTRKWFKTLVQVRGMKKLERAAFSSTYDNTWCAGQTIGLIDDIRPVETIVADMRREYLDALLALNSLSQNQPPHESR